MKSTGHRFIQRFLETVVQNDTNGQEFTGDTLKMPFIPPK